MTTTTATTTTATVSYADELRADFLRAQQAFALAKAARDQKDTPAHRQAVEDALGRINTTLDLFLVVQ